jgi:hypothetical protein
MPVHWTSEPLAALADLEFAAGNKAKAIDMEKKAIAALGAAKGSDVNALLQYEQEQLDAWTKPKKNKKM